MAIKLVSLGILVVGIFFIFFGGLNILSITGNVVKIQSDDVDVQSLYALPSIQAETKYDVSIHDSTCPNCFKRIAKVEQRNIDWIWEERIDPDPLYDRPMLMLGLSSQIITANDGEIYTRLYHPYRAHPVPQSRLRDGTPTTYKITFEMSEDENFTESIRKEVSVYLIPEDEEESKSVSSGTKSTHIALPEVEEAKSAVVVNETQNTSLENTTQEDNSSQNSSEETSQENEVAQASSSGTTSYTSTSDDENAQEESAVDLAPVAQEADAQYSASNSGFLQRLNSHELTTKEQSAIWWILLVIGVACVGFVVLRKTLKK
ncbi:MAG: hypothetical protein ACOCQQ_00155 [Candidatus Nanoarchaeia archaeon]